MLLPFILSLLFFGKSALSGIPVTDEACLDVNDPTGMIATDCITRLVTKIESNSVINFDTPQWSATRFRDYLIQDGKFLAGFNQQANHLEALCRMGADATEPDSQRANNKNQRLDDDWSDALRNVLFFPFNETRYRTRYNISEPLNSVPTGSIYLNYLAHVLSQRTCADVIAALIPCQCIYPPAVAQVYGRMQLGRSPVILPLPINQGRDTFINDNVQDFGSCHVLWGALNQLNVKFPISAYRGSLQWELNFWGVPTFLKF